jgi:hypothetical protein
MKYDLNLAIFFSHNKVVEDERVKCIKCSFTTFLSNPFKKPIISMSKNTPGSFGLITSETREGVCNISG